MATEQTAMNAPHFRDTNKAREYLEALRWPNGTICPHCGSISKEHYLLSGQAHRIGAWKCRDCRKQFSVTVGTVFEGSKIPLNVWLQAVYLLCSSKKGISSHQLHRTLGVTYKTAWFMSHRIRLAMNSDGGLLGGGNMGGSGKIVEADETYWGNGPKSGKAKAIDAEGYMRPADKKMKVFTLVERNGKARSFHVEAVTGATLKPILNMMVDQKTHVMTDESSVYRTLDKDFAEHSTVNHSYKEYVRGNAHTNTVEGFFSVLKRGLVGTYQHVSQQHLQRYLDEFDFRYSNRAKLEVTDKERADKALKGIAGKRLTYRRTHKQAQGEAKFFG